MSVHQLPLTDPCELTVVLPTFNEVENIEPMLKKIAAALDGVAWEVVVASARAILEHEHFRASFAAKIEQLISGAPEKAGEIEITRFVCVPPTSRALIHCPCVGPVRLPSFGLLKITRGRATIATLMREGEPIAPLDRWTFFGVKTFIDDNLAGLQPNRAEEYRAPVQSRCAGFQAVGADR